MEDCRRNVKEGCWRREEKEREDCRRKVKEKTIREGESKEREMLEER
jgi:hypothetical protein